MSTQRGVEHPVDRFPVRWVFDVGVALLAALAALPYLLRGGDDEPSALAFVVLVALALPLLVRRTYPLPVFVVVLAGACAAGLWSSRVNFGLGVLIALYTVASVQGRRIAAACGGVLVVGISVAGIWQFGVDFWYRVIPLAGLVVAAIGLGLYRATREAYLRELHDRADRLERERDQQVALASAAERSRISREMHDIVAHHLTVMVALSDGAVAATAGSPQDGIEVMREVSATGRRALADTRRLLGVLREPAGDTAQSTTTDDRQPMPDLAELDELIGRVRAAGLPTTLEVRGAAAEVPAGMQLTVYRVVQEALTNTMKHGGRGARAAVRFHRTPGQLSVEVDDDGGGAPPAMGGTAGVGSGLVGMRERVHAFGGEIRTGPREPSGWRVAVTLPLEDDFEDDTGDGGAT